MLSTVLTNPESLESFMQYCSKKYCTENVEFWEAVQVYKKADASERTSLAELYIDTYITQDSPQQVNIDGPAVQQILQRRSDAPCDLFDVAENIIYHLMEQDILPGFLLQEAAAKEKEQPQTEAKKKKSSRRQISPRDWLVVTTRSKSAPKETTNSGKHKHTTLHKAESNAMAKHKQQFAMLSPEARQQYLLQESRKKKRHKNGKVRFTRSMERISDSPPPSSDNHRSLRLGVKPGILFNMRSFCSWFLRVVAVGFKFACELSELPTTHGKRVVMDRHKIAIFKVLGNVYAIQDKAHKTSLSKGRIFLSSDNIPCVACLDASKLKFNLKTGSCLSKAEINLIVYPCEVMEDKVFVCPNLRPKSVTLDAPVAL